MPECSGFGTQLSEKLEANMGEIKRLTWFQETIGAICSGDVLQSVVLVRDMS